MTIINVIAMGTTLFYVRKILRPVQLMAAATERIAAGELGESVPVLSRDEMGELAHSFNRMSRELARSTVSVDFLDNILSNMRDVLIVTNADGSVRRANRAALQLLGYEEGDVIRRSASRLFEDAETLFTAESVIDLRRDGGVAAQETAMLPNQGEPIPVLVSIAPYGERADMSTASSLPPPTLPNASGRKSAYLDRWRRRRFYSRRFTTGSRTICRSSPVC